MTTMTEPLQHNQVVRFAPVYCVGKRKNGQPCNEVVFKGKLREVEQPEAAEIEDKCPRCGRVALFG